MTDIRKHVATGFAKQTFSQAKNALGIETQDNSVNEEQKGPINWRDYNYPPLIRLFHYSTTALS
jgi:hypothetical protein